MKVYSIKDLESFERDEFGRLICPTGDYTQINRFEDYYRFSEGCTFGEGCIFGKQCTFGECCTFGRYSSFGKCCEFKERCRFEEYCVFGEGCSFGECCTFGKDCSFGKCCGFIKSCRFGERCSFGEWCSFGEGCNLENNLKFENIPDAVDRVLKIDRIGSRKGCTYFFKTQNEIYVRCGCFFGTIAEFEEKVNRIYKDNEQYRKEYIKAIKYVKAIL